MAEKGIHIELWHQLRNGEKAALLSLYNDLYFHLVRFGVSVHPDSDLVKDSINQLFLKLWDKHAGLKDVDNVKSYLFSCLRNQMLDYLQVETRAVTTIENIQHESQSAPSYEDILIAVEKDQEFKEKLKVAFKHLSPKQIELIRLKFFENLSYKEIAELNTQTVKTAYNTIYDAIKVLRLKLKS